MGSDKRHEIRIPVENLPECLRVIYFSTGFFKDKRAVTMDASNYGMSFVAPDILEEEIKIGRSLTVIIKPYNYKLNSVIKYAKIVFHDKVGENILRFGVRFEDNDALKKYHKLLEMKKY